MTTHDDERIITGLERRLAAVEAFIPDPPAWRAPLDVDGRTPPVVRPGTSLRANPSVRGGGRRLVVVAAVVALLVILASSILIGSRLTRTVDDSLGPHGLLRGSDSTSSATLLADGRVLIVTGTWRGMGGTAIATATVWDPSTGMSSELDPPRDPRVNPTATLLLDGRVLVIGGFGGPYAYRGTEVATAEVWDPATEAFTPTGSMADGRVGHTATLLTDGRVLVIGGNGAGDDAARAEVWDPATGRFTQAGVLGGWRVGHTATLRSDGRVLVHGGVGPDGVTLMDYRTWDPATSTFDDGGQWFDRPTSATMTRLSDGRLLLIGGIARGGSLSDAVWDFAFLRAEDWGGDPTDITNLDLGRFNHAAVLLPDDRVLVLGGMIDDTTSTASVEIFDPATASFTPAAPLPRPIADPTAVLLRDGRVLVIDDRGLGPPRYDVYEPDRG